MLHHHQWVVHHATTKAAVAAVHVAHHTGHQHKVVVSKPIVLLHVKHHCCRVRHEVLPVSSTRSVPRLVVRWRLRWRVSRWVSRGILLAPDFNHKASRQGSTSSINMVKTIHNLNSCTLTTSK